MNPVVISILILSVIGIAFVAVVANEIRKRKQGKGSCSCGGSCGACPVGCHCHDVKDATDKKD